MFKMKEQNKKPRGKKKKSPDEMEINKLSSGGPCMTLRDSECLLRGLSD